MEHECDKHNKKHCIMKFISIVLATFLGAFLAFYFVIDSTIKNLTDPMHQMKRFDKMMAQQDREMMKMEKRFRKSTLTPFHKPIVSVDENPVEYVIVVNLKPFDNKKENVKITTKDDLITITGEIEKNKNNEERIMSFSQTFNLDEDAKISELQKKVVKDKYIITVPKKVDE